jgi:hypothetical protein
MEHLDSDKIFDLNIIKNVDEDFYDFYNRIDEITARDTTSRKLFEPETSKSYAQLFSVLCFVRDLSRSKRFFYIIKQDHLKNIYIHFKQQIEQFLCAMYTIPSKIFSVHKPSAMD